MTAVSTPPVQGLFRSYELRVKIRSLAAEAKIIRHEEKRALRRRRRAMERAGKVNDQQVHDDKTKFHGSAFASLREHRLKLREHSRWAQLAFAFLRGRPYLSVEAKRKPEREFLFRYHAVREITANVVRFTTGSAIGSVASEATLTAARERLKPLVKEWLGI